MSAEHDHEHSHTHDHLGVDAASLHTRVRTDGYWWKWTNPEKLHLIIFYEDQHKAIRSLSGDRDALVHTKMSTQGDAVICTATWLLIKEPTNPLELLRCDVKLPSLDRNYLDQAFTLFINHFLKATYGRPSNNLPDAEGSQRRDNQEEAANVAASIGSS